MKLTARLYEAARPVWAGYHTHPFVTGLGDGSLPVEKFRFFLLQDYLYLWEYARVFALGVVKANTPELMRFFADNVTQILDGEMDIHRAYMARLGITEAQAAAARPALPNRSYTSYMLAAAHAGGPLEILAAILACSWSYAEIAGQLLAQNPAAIDHPLYGEWVAGYTSEDYVRTNAALMDRLDALTEGCPPEQAARLEDIFVACSRYEALFWDMAWAGEE